MAPLRSGWRSGLPTANGSRPTAHLMPWKRNPRALPPLQQNRSPGANSAASSSRSSRSCARILCPISRFPPNRAGARPHTAHQAPLSRWRCPQGSHASLLAKHPPTLPARPRCPPTRPQGLTIRQAIFSIQHAILHCSPRASHAIAASPIYGFCKTVHKRLKPCIHPRGD